MPTRSWRRLAWHIAFYWLPFIGWMAWIVILSAQPKLPHPMRRMGISDYLFDYTAHALTFGLLVWLAWRVRRLYPTSRGLTPLLSASLWALFYAFSDELHQQFVPGRTASLRDWLADAAGIVLAAGLLALWQRLGVRLPWPAWLRSALGR